MTAYAGHPVLRQDEAKRTAAGRGALGRMRIAAGFTVVGMMILMSAGRAVSVVIRR